MDPFFLLFVFRVILPCLFFTALLSSAGKVLTFVMFSCVFVTFPYGVLDQVWYLIVSIPDICLLPYFLCIYICWTPMVVLKPEGFNDPERSSRC